MGSANIGLPVLWSSGRREVVGVGGTLWFSFVGNNIGNCGSGGRIDLYVRGREGRNEEGRKGGEGSSVPALGSFGSRDGPRRGGRGAVTGDIMLWLSTAGVPGVLCGGF